MSFEFLLPWTCYQPFWLLVTSNLYVYINKYPYVYRPLPTKNGKIAQFPTKNTTFSKQLKKTQPRNFQCRYPSAPGIMDRLCKTVRRPIQQVLCWWILEGIDIRYCWWSRNPGFTSWGWENLPFIIYMVLYIPGGPGILPSTVSNIASLTFKQARNMLEYSSFISIIFCKARK